MLRYLCLLVLALGVIESPSPASADEDLRTTVSLPSDVRDGFLAEMRTHMANLDDIIAALAEDDFEGAARIVDINMSPGHRRWAKMAEEGASDEEIAAARAEFAKKHGSGGGRRGGGMGKGGGMGMGPGFGRFMPEDFRYMGASFHEATASFAETARSVTTPTSPEDYRAVFDALQGVTTSCRACHDAFRIEIAE